MAMKIIFIIVLLNVFTTSQTQPWFPYGGFSSPLLNSPFWSNIFRYFGRGGTYATRPAQNFNMMPGSFGGLLRSFGLEGTGEPHTSNQVRIFHPNAESQHVQIKILKNRAMDDDEPPQMRSTPTNDGQDTYANKPTNDTDPLPRTRALEGNTDNKFVQRYLFPSDSAEDSSAETKEIKGNVLELEEEYDQKRQRDTEWEQSEYDNEDWEDTNDIDEMGVHNEFRKTSPPDLRGDTYVNELLAARGAKINPEAEAISSGRNNDREVLEYNEQVPQLRRRPNYHGDINVNNILAARNAPVNPNVEFIPASSRYAMPIEVHYDYELDDTEDDKKYVDLTRDIEINNILAAQGAPLNPHAEIVNVNYAMTEQIRNPILNNRGEYFGDTYVNEILTLQGSPTNPDAEDINSFAYKGGDEAKQRGQYYGDTYVNELLAQRGTHINPDAEIFTPEDDVLEFVPLDAPFRHDLKGDIDVNKIAEARGLTKNPDAEEFDTSKTARHQSRNKK